jgi:hypothetical protein
MLTLLPCLGACVGGVRAPRYVRKDCTSVPSVVNPTLRQHLELMLQPLPTRRATGWIGHGARPAAEQVFTQHMWRMSDQQVVRG